MPISKLSNKCITHFFFNISFIVMKFWGNTSHTYLDLLIKCQIKIIRIMTFLQYDAHSKPLFIKLHILDLQKLIFHKIALMMYKHPVQLLPLPVSNLRIKKILSIDIIRGHVICYIQNKFLRSHIH